KMPTNEISIMDITKRESCKQFERSLNDIKKIPKMNTIKRIIMKIKGTSFIHQCFQEQHTFGRKDIIVTSWYNDAINSQSSNLTFHISPTTHLSPEYCKP